MTYRRMGHTGLQLSTLSFGSWVTFNTQLDVDRAVQCMDAARQAGCNFFDNAEGYANGKSEQIMGQVFAELGWKRNSYVVSSKYFWGIDGEMPNMRNTLNRKYLMHAVEGSLERMDLEFLDIIYCHRPDPHTPVAETVWAMSNLIDAGLALYWGTSEWSAERIREAWDVADRHHLHKPVVEQPQYHLLDRTKVEDEFADLYDTIGLGLTTWSPLASGLLTGKYRDGIPADSRAALPGYGWLSDQLTDAQALAMVEALRPIAEGLGCTLAQLAIAWCTKNSRVTTVITGASRPEQVTENFAALQVAELLTVDLLEQIDRAVGASA